MILCCSVERRINLVWKPWQSSHLLTLEEGYIGQTKVRFGRRTHEHAHTDKESAIYKNSVEKNIVVTHENFRILEKGFNKLVDRRIAESLYVKDYQPKLNEQKDSYKLKLFN